MKSNLIINILLKVQSFFLQLWTVVRLKFFPQSKDDVIKAGDDQQHKSTISEDESIDLSIENEESEIWFDAKSKLESEIDEDEFFNALSPDEYSDYVSEDEGYISSNSKGESTSVKNVVIENDQYYSIDGLQKKTSLSSYGNDTLALAFSGEASEKISSGKLYQTRVELMLKRKQVKNNTKKSVRYEFDTNRNTETKIRELAKQLGNVPQGYGLLKRCILPI